MCFVIDYYLTYQLKKELLAMKSKREDLEDYERYIRLLKYKIAELEGNQKFIADN